MANCGLAFGHRTRPHRALARQPLIELKKRITLEEVAVGVGENAARLCSVHNNLPREYAKDHENKRQTQLTCIIKGIPSLVLDA